MADAWSDDEQLLAWLAEAMAEARAVPADFVAAGKAAYAWHDIDAELAALAYDSAALDAAAATVRADRTAHRNLTFTSASLTVEIEVDGNAVRGQLIPSGAATDEVAGPPALASEVTIQALDGQDTTTPIDELGYFTVEALPRSAFRLRCRLVSGATVVTGWITP